MNERFIILLEKFFDKQISTEEKSELDQIIKDNENLRKEFEEQKKIKEVLNKMKMKNPGREVWDGYWFGIYNRIERGLAWIAISIGAVIIFGFASIRVVEALIQDSEMPAIVKVGIVVLFFGILVLLFSLIREKIFSSKNDKYKEIQR